MRELNLYKIWEVMNSLSEKEQELSEKNIYISLLGNSSEYCPQEFDSFLNYYSFKIDGDRITIFNIEPIPYESFGNNDVSYFPSVLLSFGTRDLDEWMENEIESQLKQQEFNKIAEKENLKRKIELLQKQLEND